jgi:hypothetical protein
MLYIMHCRVCSKEREGWHSKLGQHKGCLCNWSIKDSRTGFHLVLDIYKREAAAPYASRVKLLYPLLRYEAIDQTIPRHENYLPEAPVSQRILLE